MPLAIPAVYENLKKVRVSKTVSLKPSQGVRDTIIAENGDKIQFKLRNYQSIGVYHLLTMKRFLLGDDTGLGKTIQVLSTFSYLYDRNPNYKCIIIAPKSALVQWQNEMERFLCDLRGIHVKGTLKERIQLYSDFFSSKNKDKCSLILNYHTLTRDWDEIKECIDANKPLDILTVFDEAVAFKNPKTKTHEICSELSVISDRVYGLTATVLKNNLMEGFGVFKIIVPGIWKNKTRFMNDFCITRMQKVTNKTGRKIQIPIVIGYQNLNKFRNDIDPYFLGRAKNEVSDELPKIITREINLDLTPEQEKKYAESLEGFLILSDEVKETTKLTQLIYCQQIVDSLYLLGIEAKSNKEEELFRLLEEELSNEKVIIYSNYRKMVDRLETLFIEKKIKCTRITGVEKDNEREDNKRAFQDPNSGIDIIMITNAGSAAINLQAASTLIFFDSPWSYGDYKQLLGRMVRIGSKHSTVLVLHFVVTNTIDKYVLKTLQKKKGIIDPLISGDSDALDFDSTSDIDEIFNLLKKDAERIK